MNKVLSQTHWIGRFIREERLRQGMTQRELAEKNGTGRGRLADYENRHHYLRSLIALEKLLRTLGFELKVQRVK